MIDTTSLLSSNIIKVSLFLDPLFIALDEFHKVIPKINKIPSTIIWIMLVT